MRFNYDELVYLEVRIQKMLDTTKLIKSWDSDEHKLRLVSILKDDLHYVLRLLESY